jgi:hypothetical protein
MLLSKNQEEMMSLRVAYPNKPGDRADAAFAHDVGAVRFRAVRTVKPKPSASASENAEHASCHKC